MPAKILLVDDDLQSLKLVGLMLQRRGHSIIAARGGEQALQKAKTEQPDLMILDIMMPDLDGLEVCRRLRSDPATKDIAIIMFTAKALVRDKVDGFQAGADDYLIKPIHPNDLAARVEAVLQRSVSNRPHQPDRVAGRIIGFLGVKGGVGTTTLALNVAAALSDPPEQRVIVADLQASAANVAVQLKMSSSGGLNAFAQQPAQDITPAAVEPQLVEHATGVRILLSNTERDPDAVMMSAEQLRALIASLSRLAACVVLDLGSILDELTLAAVDGCQQIVLVMDPQRIALAAARNLLAQLERQGLPAQRLVVAVIDRAPGMVAVDKRAIESQLNLPVALLLPPVPELANQAAQDGALLLQLQSRGPIVDQVREFARSLMG